MTTMASAIDRVAHRLRAADQAGPGTTVHILPGVYRETVTPALNGSVAQPVLYLRRRAWSGGDPRL